MNFPQLVLKQQLAWLRSRYDHGAIPAGIFNTIKIIETELAWHEHRASADDADARMGPSS